MNFIFTTLAFSLGLGLIMVRGDDIVITSPPVSKFGSWGRFENCSEKNLVTAFQLKMEPKHSLVDDSGLNGVRFFCGLPPTESSSPSPAAPISEVPRRRYPNRNDDGAIEVVSDETPVWENVTSRVGQFGKWGKIFNCSTFAVGFNLEVQPPQGRYKDDVAATNLKLLCADGTEIEGYFNNGHGHAFANTSYTGSQRCPTGYAICGLQTQVESYQAFGDDTALNNIEAKCCSIQDSHYAFFG